MAYAVFVIDVNDNSSITALSNKLQNPGDPADALNNCTNLITAISAGTLSGKVQVTVRGTDPTVSTQGTGSTQVTYNKI